MGKLGSQKPRDRHIHNDRHLSMRLEELLSLANKANVPVDTLVKIEIAMHLRSIVDVLADSGDKSDENLAGLGDIISNLGNK
ncbi:hypothetical protein [Erwinia sp. JH02]|uniref:hypothetical protein n=1 Tax=Erwinia sp. JH02 TaxID=2733394 RepID=UPI00148893D4|nr:hypothetical protein [Erwinia sp. JH02]NNS07281.1 hypothetical protein [Erwinia sp. JH02]